MIVMEILAQKQQPRASPIWSGLEARYYGTRLHRCTTMRESCVASLINSDIGTGILQFEGKKE